MPLQERVSHDMMEGTHKEPWSSTYNGDLSNGPVKLVYIGLSFCWTLATAVKQAQRSIAWACKLCSQVFWTLEVVTQTASWNKTAVLNQSSWCRFPRSLSIAVVTLWQVAPGDDFQFSCTTSLPKYHTTRLEFEQTRLGAKPWLWFNTYPSILCSERTTFTIGRCSTSLRKWGNGRGCDSVLVCGSKRQWPPGIHRVLMRAQIVTLLCKKTLLAADHLQKPGQWSITWAWRSGAHWPG